MGLIKCRTCKNEISSNAEICPTCGEKEPSSTKRKMIGILLLIPILYLLYHIFMNIDGTIEEYNSIKNFLEKKQ